MKPKDIVELMSVAVGTIFGCLVLLYIVWM